MLLRFNNLTPKSRSLVEQSIWSITIHYGSNAAKQINIVTVTIPLRHKNRPSHAKSHSPAQKPVNGNNVRDKNKTGKLKYKEARKTRSRNEIGPCQERDTFL